MLRKITAQQLDEYWSLAAPLLEPAIDRAGLQTTESIFADLQACNSQLWVGDDAAAVTNVQDHPRARVCTVWLAGGEGLDVFKAHLKGIEDWARSIGCDRVSIQGRFGWEKVLPDYERAHVVLNKRL